MANDVTMVFWDVQHGHAAYIKSPNERHIVIDLGTGDYSGNNIGFSPLIHLYNKYFVRQLDVVVITHPHRDHIDDILNFDIFRPKVFLRPRQLTNTEVMSGVREKDLPKFRKYCDLNSLYINNFVGTIDDPGNAPNYGGMKMLYFTPFSCPHSNFNNHSILTVIEYAGIKVVVPGDNEICSLNELMNNINFRNAVRDSDILLAPHHGRESAFHQGFVSLVNPRLTIVSDGSICDTSANPRYSRLSRGWTVYKKSTGQTHTRHCLTTNSDGEVYINFGFSNDFMYNNTLYVSIP